MGIGGRGAFHSSSVRHFGHMQGVERVMLAWLSISASSYRSCLYIYNFVLGVFDLWPFTWRLGLYLCGYEYKPKQKYAWSALTYC